MLVNRVSFYMSCSHNGNNFSFFLYIYGVQYTQWLVILFRLLITHFRGSNQWFCRILFTWKNVLLILLFFYSTNMAAKFYSTAEPFPGNAWWTNQLPTTKRFEVEVFFEQKQHTEYNASSLLLYCVRVRFAWFVILDQSGNSRMGSTVELIRICVKNQIVKQSRVLDRYVRFLLEMRDICSIDEIDAFHVK